MRCGLVSRGAHKSSIQRASSAATKCSVPRNGQVRTIERSAMAVRPRLRLHCGCAARWPTTSRDSPGPAPRRTSARRRRRGRTDYDRCAAGASAGRRVGWRVLGGCGTVYTIPCTVPYVCTGPPAGILRLLNRGVRPYNSAAAHREVRSDHVVDAVATRAEADQLRHSRDPESHRAAGGHFVRRRPAFARHVSGRAPARESGGQC